MNIGEILVVGMFCAVALGAVAGFGLYAIKTGNLPIFASLLALFVVAVITFARLGFISFGSHILENCNATGQCSSTDPQVNRGALGTIRNGNP